MMKHYLRAFGMLLLLLSSFAVAIAQETNLLPNGDLETITPNFWEKLNGTTECIWATDTAAATANSRRSFKIVKTAATSDVVGWRSVNNANLYWNHAGSDGGDTYNLSFTAKTEGVNTSPASDDEKIGVMFKFYAGGVLLAEKLVAVDQTTADAAFTTFNDVVLVSATPDEVIAELIMGKDATGTVWFDNIGCNTNAGWTMGIFNGDAETPTGWMNWSAATGFANFVDMGDSAHSGSYAALLEENDTDDDEMVFYSEPVAATAGKMYKLSFWVKTEGINTDSLWYATNVSPDYDNQRANLCFFFHKAPLETNWDLVGGDQFVNIDQRTGKENEGWTYYSVVAKAPEEAAGVSVRARFNNFVTGKVWFDDFTVEEITTDDNVLANGDIETVEPNFWSKLPASPEFCSWATDTAAATPNSRRSFKIAKTGPSSDDVGWVSVNNANLYWNHAGSDGGDTYNLSFTAKTEGVNLNPTDDSTTIAAYFIFLDASDNVLGGKQVKVDQSTASTNFKTYNDVVLISATPANVYVKLMMGKAATGTVWFDNIGCNTNAGWTMGIFNGDAETPAGWMNWSSDNGFANFVDMGDSAHSGTNGVLLEENDNNDDEMVFYSEPGVATAGEWYLVNFWTKTEGLNTGDLWYETNVTPDYDKSRASLCFFFHKAPLETNWDLVGGDQFAYIDQRVGKENQDWTLHQVIAKAPDEAAGVSVRARFNNFTTGKVWYDDFAVQKVTLVYTSIEDYGTQGVHMVKDYRLENNYPNPFNPLTHIEYTVSKASNVTLAVYNILGQKIRTLAAGFHQKGTFYALWDGRNDFGNMVSSGIYLYQLQGENSVITKKMTFLK